MDSNNELPRSAFDRNYIGFFRRWLEVVKSAWEIGCECHRCLNVQREAAGDIRGREYMDLSEVHFFADYDAGMVYRVPVDLGKTAIGVVHPYEVDGSWRNATPGNGSGPSLRPRSRPS